MTKACENKKAEHSPVCSENLSSPTSQSQLLEKMEGDIERLGINDEGSTSDDIRSHDDDPQEEESDI